MSWLSKLSSTTFQLEFSNKIAQPKNIYWVGADLLTWADKHVPRYYFDMAFPIIQADGFDEGFIGVINWYIEKPEYAKDVPMYVNQWIQEECLPHGIDAKVGKLERSNMFSDRLVQRIHILRNDTVEYTNLPKMTLAEDNIRIVFNVLGLLVSPWEGKMGLQEMLQHINSVSNEAVTQFARPAEIGRIVRDFGVDEQGIRNYLERLKAIVEYGLKNGFKNIVWG
jgi:hypothetical protein